uniref:Uncharacterized protein n=1 Tax=Panagrolaimus superbus TaxID=310955 RepID=A0A914Z7U0_9BILA
MLQGPTPTDPTQPKLYFIILPPPPVNNQTTLSQTNNGGGGSKMSNKVRKAHSSSNSSDMINQKVIKQEIMEPSTDSAEFNVTALSSLRGNEIPSSSHANNEYGILQNSSGFKEGQISSGFISQRVIKQEIMEPSTDESNFKAPPRVQGLPSYPHNSAEMLNNDQEVGITSNTDLILSRCLQLSKS